MPHVENGKSYRWAHPSEWLAEKIDEHAQAGEVAQMVALLNHLITRLSEDDVQDLFQSEMDADGYFKPLRKKG